MLDLYSATGSCLGSLLTIRWGTAGTRMHKKEGRYCSANITSHIYYIALHINTLTRECMSLCQSPGMTALALHSSSYRLCLAKVQFLCSFQQCSSKLHSTIQRRYDERHLHTFVDYLQVCLHSLNSGSRLQGCGCTGRIEGRLLKPHKGITIKCTDQG